MENINLTEIFPDLARITAQDTRKRFYLPPIKIVKTYGRVENS